MISISTFWITSIVVLILATLIVTIISIKTDKDKLSVGVNLLGAYILIALVMTVMLTPIESYYIDGRVILNIENIIIHLRVIL